MGALVKVWNALKLTWSREWIEVMVEEPDRARPQYTYMAVMGLVLTLLLGLFSPASGIILIGWAVGSGLMAIFPGLRPGKPTRTIERLSGYIVFLSFGVLMVISIITENIFIAAVTGAIVAAFPFLWALVFPRARSETEQA